MASEDMMKLTQQLNELTAKMAELHTSAQRPVTVEVCASTHRLKLFSGLPPTGGGEVSFPDWESQVEGLLRDTSVSNPLPRILGSLKGIAYEQAKSATSAAEVLNVLRSTYSDTRCADDKFLHFSRLTPKARESAPDFLCRLWSEMTKLNQPRAFSDADAQKRVYHIFCKGISPLLALELRGTFGFAGEASPKMEDVLKAVKRLDGTTESPAVAREAANRTIQVDSLTAAVREETPLTLTEEQLDRLAEKVADILARKQRPPRGACYGCGSREHFVRDCPRRAGRQQGQHQGNASPSASGSGC